MMLKPIVTSLALIALASTGNWAAASGDRLYVPITAPPSGRPVPAFSDGVLSGNTFYIAGHIGRDPTTHRVPDDPDAEARYVMDDIQLTLKAAGLTWDDAISVTVYCTDLALYDRFNAVYRTYFHDHYPARAFIGVKDLSFGGHFEVVGVAQLSPQQKKPKS
jgi:2-iminobutanoate/2-iminopropanoate deaminase